MQIGEDKYSSRLQLDAGVATGAPLQCQSPALMRGPGGAAVASAATQ